MILVVNHRFDELWLCSDVGGGAQQVDSRSRAVPWFFDSKSCSQSLEMDTAAAQAVWRMDETDTNSIRVISIEFN